MNSKILLPSVILNRLKRNSGQYGKDSIMLLIVFMEAEGI